MINPKDGLWEQSHEPSFLIVEMRNQMQKSRYYCCALDGGGGRSEQSLRAFSRKGALIYSLREYVRSARPVT